MGGTTKGILVSLTLFNVVVDNVMRTWLVMTVEDQRVAHDDPGRDDWSVFGSLLCQQWHGHLTQLRLAAAQNERPGWDFQKVWPGGQHRKVMHNNMPARSITGEDVRGGHGAEVHGGGRLILSETLKLGTMPEVWSGTHRKVHC